MAPSKRKNKKKKKSKLPFLLVALTFAALFIYWQNSGVVLFPSENPPAPQVAVTAPVEPAAPAEVVVAPEVVTVPSHDQEAASAEEDSSPEDEIERAWDREVLGHLNRLEPTRANDLYTAYLQERERFSKSLERSLAQSLSLLTDGPSQTSEGNTNEEHQRRLVEIFGKHYDYIQSQRQKFLESYRDINPTDVAKE